MLKNSKAIADLKNMIKAEWAAAAAFLPPAEPPATSQKLKKKKKKGSNGVTETVMEEATGTLNVAAIETGTAGMEEAEVCLAKRAVERKKVVTAGHFFALYANLPNKMPSSNGTRLFLCKL